MKTVSGLLLIMSIALVTYGYWGAFTESGNKVYDEMDGYYPFFMMIIGAILLIVFLIMRLIMRRKGKRS